MSLDVTKLEKVRELALGIVQARCPACAEEGHDRSGEHLRIYPDGRFGCCVHPKDREHRKRIWALAGERKSGTFSLRLKTPPAITAITSVKAFLTAFDGGTVGTGKGGLVFLSAISAAPAELKTSEFGTDGAAILKLRARARVDSTTDHISMVDSQEKLKDLGSAVLTVPVVPIAGVVEPPSAAGEHLPFLTAGGDLSIPFDSPERYHWWKLDGKRQSVAETLKEVKERMKNAITV